MEYFTKIVYLLSLFFPVMLFFTVGLWVAWVLWFKQCRDFHTAIEEHHHLVDELNELYTKQYQLTEQYEQLRGLYKNGHCSHHHSKTPQAHPADIDEPEIEALKQELHELRSLLHSTDADAPIDNFSDIHIVEAILTDFTDDPVRNSPDFGVIYSEKPDLLDELTEIDSLTTNDAVRLNQLGIYQFRQIALWAPMHTAAIKQKLQLGEETDPAEWQAQAAHLQHAKPALSRD